VDSGDELPVDLAAAGGDAWISHCMAFLRNTNGAGLPAFVWTDGLALRALSNLRMRLKASLDAASGGLEHLGLTEAPGWSPTASTGQVKTQRNVQDDRMRAIIVGAHSYSRPLQ